MLLKYSNNKNDVDFLYSKLIRTRNVCGLFPFKSHNFVFHKAFENNDYISFINRLDINNNNGLKKFCMIYNCMVNVCATQYVSGKHGAEIYGLDGWIYQSIKENSKTSTTTETNTDNETLSLLNECKSFILDQMAQSGIFGNRQKLYITKTETMWLGSTENEKSQYLIVKEDAIKDILETVFNNDLKSFSKLVEYCIQDIREKDLIKLNQIHKVHVSHGRVGYDYGISFFVLNRLSYLIYHDLMWYDNNNSNNMLFPSLTKFYTFWYNMAIYFHCYPQFKAGVGDDENIKNSEIFYVKQYGYYRHKLYDNILQAQKLNNINYCCQSDHCDGTLLHIAVYCKFSRFVSLLLKDGFNPNVKNRQIPQQHKTPQEIAQRENHFEIVSLFDKWNINNKSINRGVTVTETKENNNENNGRNDMDSASLEVRYNSLMNQVSSCLYILKKMGFDDINKENDKRNMKDIEKVISSLDTERDGMRFGNDFYRSWTHLIGLKGVLSHKDGTLTINNLLKVLESLIEMKMPICDDLLVLSCMYSNDFIQFLKKEIIVNCLNETNNDFKSRNYQWFKHYILESNIFFVKLNINDNPNDKLNDNNKTDDNSKTKFNKNRKYLKKKNNVSVRPKTRIVFDDILIEVDKLLLKQKQYIWDNVNEMRESKEDDTIFKQLCQFDNESGNINVELRQDKIKDGIVSSVDEIDVLVASIEMGNEAHSRFNLSFENNSKVYLTQCLSFAHSNNNKFQQEMSNYFNNKCNIKCQYQSAPVKLYDRCVVKATSDYSDAQYPTCANILDFLRFSVTFNNVNDFINGLNKFVNDINKGNVFKYLVPMGVLRIKNGFQDILTNWKNVNDAQYCDIKLNIIYQNQGKNNDSGYNNSNYRQCMIVEAQFLLSFLLKAKKMGHKYYSIVRKSEFINNIKNEVYLIDNDYNKYKLKINSLISNHDSNGLIKQLFWKPNIVLSIINEDTYKYRPLLYSIGDKFSGINDKLILFFLNCLFHLSFVLLNESNDKNNKFLKLYFNWASIEDVMKSDEWTFQLYGIDVSKVSTPVFKLLLQKDYLEIFKFLKQDLDYVCKRVLLTFDVLQA